MTLEEVLSKRDELRDKIHNLVFEFEKETLWEVDKVDVCRRYNQMTYLRTGGSLLMVGVFIKKETEQGKIEVCDKK